MVKIPGLFLILLLAFTGSVCAQATSVTGKIINKEDSKPVESANITLLQDGSIIYHTVSDSAGNFRIPISYYNSMSTIRVSGVNLKELTLYKKTIPTDLKSADFNLGVLIVKSAKIELKEVKILSKRRYSDTTNFDLSKKKFERSVMVDDLFSTEFGFTKDKDGHLYYKGDLVSDVLVNGGDFFGKNNLDIYHLLPALTMENIQIVKTNIDSVTNTTRLRPTVKINLKLKAEYNKGKFGNANLGGGTSERYLANTDLYTYRNKQQISLDINANNINAGENLIYPPSVSFSSSGNNTNNRGAVFKYRNFAGRKIEVNFSLKGKFDNKLYTSLSERNDLEIHQFSRTTNTSDAKSYGLDNQSFNINYRIDALNSINISETASAVHNKLNDSLNYRITTDSTNTASKVSRVTNSTIGTLSGKVIYLKRFASKKGRLINISAIYNKSTYNIIENDNIAGLNNNLTTNYFVDGKRSVKNHQLTINTSYTEPLGEDSYLVLFANYKKDDIVEGDQVKSDTSVSYLVPATINNQYIESGAKFQRTFARVSFDGSVNGILNLRNIQSMQSIAVNSLKLNFDFKADYKIDTRKTLLFNYSLITNYPDINQLTSINSTFDLVSQMSGNASLKPEDKYSARASYDLKQSDTETLSFAAELNYYTSRFGYALVTAGTFLNSVTTNVGNAKSGTLSFSFNKTFANQHSISSNTGLSYQEEPSFINSKMVLNNGFVFNQSLSTTIPVIKSIVTLSPLISASYSKYYYGTSSSNVLSITYSDRVSVNVLQSQLSLFPLLTYNHNFGSNESFSMNAEIKRSFLKNFMSVYIQAYDIFNSFKFYNNYNGPTFTQTTSYSNVQRYVFMGVSYKFNNFK